MRNLTLAVFALALIVTVTAAGSASAQCVTRTLTCGSTTTVSLSPSGCIIDGFPTQRFSFSATAGQKLTVIASNTNGNSIGMQLTTSSGQYITSGFDEPAQISNTFTTAGQYFIDVSFGNPHISGNITVEATCAAGTPPPGTTTCQYSGQALIGQSISGALTTADTPCGDTTTYARAYKVPVTAGDAFTVDYAASYPVLIEVAGPDSTSVFRWSNGTTLSTAYVANTTGNVTIYVESNTKTPVTGTFTLTLTPLTLPACGRVRAVRH